jgi:hypothetical protein
MPILRLGDERYFLASNKSTEKMAQFVDLESKSNSIDFLLCSDEDSEDVYEASEADPAVARRPAATDRRPRKRRTVYHSPSLDDGPLVDLEGDEGPLLPSLDAEQSILGFLPPAHGQVQGGSNAGGKQVTRWCITFYGFPNGLDTDETRRQWHTALASDKCKVKRIVWQVEKCPSTDRRHLQGYVVFKRSVTLAHIQKCFPGAHAEPVKGSEGDNVAYCTKEDTRDFGPFFYPSKELFSLEITRKKNATLLSFKKRIDEGKRPQAVAEAEEELFPAYIRNQKAINAYAVKRQWSCKPRRTPFVLYLYGKPGVGKSHFAHALMERLKVDDYFATTMTTEYLHGYDGHEHVILDEFCPEQQSLQFMNAILDKYPTSVKVFYGMEQWKANFIVLCSNYPLKECYKDSPYHDSFTRRISGSVHMLGRADEDMFKLILGKYEAHVANA